MIKLFRHLKPFSLSILFILIFIFGQAMAELYLPTLMSEIVNNGMMQGDTAYIMKYGFYMLLVAMGSTVFSIMGAFLSARVAMGLGRILRNLIFRRIENYSLKEFDTIGTSSLITRTTNDIVQIQTVLVMMLRFMIYAPVMCVGGIIMAVSRDRGLTVIFLVVIPVLLTVMGSLAIVVIPSFKQLQKKLDRLNMVLRENLTGIRVIRAFNKLEFEGLRFKEANRDLTDVSIRVNKIMAIMQPVMILILNLTTASIIWFGGVRVAQNSMTVGDMMAFIQYAMQILFSFVMVAIMFVMVPRAQASAERVGEVLEMAPDIQDPEQPQTTQGKFGSLELRNVCFSYPGAENPAVDKISFSTYPGEMTAIIGGTGSGKSTLLNLIMRFYDVCGGQILIDGIDIRHMTQKALRRMIGFVPQSAMLFSGTVSDNIRFGKPDATEKDIREAAVVAHALEFIDEMPEGFEAPISQGGTNLSGGQKQRLSIARALVRRPEIYMFDDSFSALDFKTDSSLREALRKETRGAAVIIVAQRVSTIMNADQIIVLENGEIVGIGKHHTLLETCDIYREIVSTQLSKEDMER